MSTVDPIKIDGLRDFQAALRHAEDGLQKQLRIVFNEAAELVVGSARPLVPRRTGKLAATLKTASGQRNATVKMGSAKTPYAGWIEFGGRVGRDKSIRRPFIKAGRSLYPGVRKEEQAIAEVMARGLNRLADEAGL